ncbi:sucrase ferredoxin [Corynebacterium urealyticum]|uniref:Sucrase ferredoxin n=1 Tax=Corynebacterium urealyticum TaxID=43771 RepID=A0A5D4FM09_9CORY|nr:sucrase ferredoxin [Corynebacterium urealyticum]TYR16954.1 sucrase ferredoxin [Corynebacterium urealyticum]
MATSRNPLAGVSPHEFTTEQLDDAPTICSTFTGEQLAGTAKPGKIILCLEFYTGWGHDILDGTAFGAELNAKIKTFLKDNGAELQFIRRPGREGQDRRQNNTRVLYIAWATGTEPVLERMDLPDVEALLDLDLSTPGNTPGARRVDHPILLVCTHGRRDRCCAVRGRPLAAALNNHFADAVTGENRTSEVRGRSALAQNHADAAGVGAGPVDPKHAEFDDHSSVDPIDPIIWESSHTKGHRFAPSMLLLPANYSFGRMAEGGARSMVEHAQRGELWLQGNRGRGCLDPASQAAELRVAHELDDRGLPVGLAALTSWEETPQNSDEETTQSAADVAVRVVEDTASGLRFRVRMERRDSVMVVSSCGDNPKRSKSWIAVDCEEILG